ncbi:thiamine biosynthesis lipoprotein [Alteromonadaceae bacterium 2753L.S.0a.02]|nr:thiamine biosynthesis lipoprotein [Alteromonadaceae bacterium 2753L.S.0a.02]
MFAAHRFIPTIIKASPVLLVSLCFFILSACSQQEPLRVFKLEGRTMGTTYHITAVAGVDVSVSETALQMKVDKALEDVNQVMSTYIPDSELSMLNHEPVGSPRVVSPQLFDILVLSRKISAFTEGVFDVTVGPVVNLWGFGPEEMKEKAPSEAQVQQALARVGYQHIVLDDVHQQVTRGADIYIDLSAIAKGYGADVIANLFRDEGIANYIIELGGELAISGTNPKGVPWRIGIEQPTLAQTGVMQAISIESGGIATSGDYRNYFEVDGQRYSHTINPFTGRPITHTLASITLVSRTAAEADALATALNVMGPQKGYDFAVTNGLAAYFIIREGESFITKASPEFEQYRVNL